MIVSDYLDSIEGTEQEAVLLKAFTELTEDKDIAKVFGLPIVGKLIKALVVLGSSESIDAFRQTEHYMNIKDWGITVFDLEKGYISIHPGLQHRKKIFIAAIAIGIGIYLIRRCKKRRMGL